MTIIFNERFEATGYDESGWAEVIGGACVCDEDYAVSGVAGAAANWGTRCLRVNKVLGQSVYTWRSLASNQAIAYFRAGVIINSTTGLAAGEDIVLLQVNDDGGNPAFQVLFGKVLTKLKFKLVAYHDGSANTYTGFPDLALDTSYSVEIKWDATNDEWSWKINLVHQRNNVDSTQPVTSPGTLTLTHPTHCRTHYLGANINSGDFVINVFYDNFGIDDTDWLGLAPVWKGKINGVTNPAKVAGVDDIYIKRVMGVNSN